MTKTYEEKYTEWLSAIANSRLIFNTLGELEDYLDNHNITTNGIKRCFPTKQKVRSAFNDLYMYVNGISDGNIKFDEFMIEYERASKLFKKRLSRRIEHEKIAMAMLKHFFSYERVKFSKCMLEIMEEIDNQDIDITMIVMMLMDVFHGYDSKEGDSDDFGERYNAMLSLLGDFTKDCPYFDTLPAVAQAKHENNKTRLTLYMHVNNIIGTYSSFTSSSDIIELAQKGKEKRIHLDIDGYWNECDGRPDRTDFYKIEETLDDGIYMATKYNKLSDGKIEKARFMMTLSASDDGRVLMYLVHPKAPKHLLAGIRYDETDHVWYTMDMPSDRSDVNVMNFGKRVPYKSWQSTLNLTRVTDEKITKIYDTFLEEGNIINPYKEWEYNYERCLYAITQNALYIVAEEDGFYKVPLQFDETFKDYNLNSNVGRLTMNSQTYLAFDDIMKYVPKNKFKHYGIKLVKEIE